MKKIFPLFVAVACCSMVFGQIISVTDGTLADWGNVPSEYLFKTECAPNASKDGLKSVQVYVDLTYINLLVEVNDDVVTDREVTPFHVFINSDNNAATGGFGDQWTIADTDLMFETLIFASGAVNPYNPAVFKWWGPNGENGWLWTDPDVEGTAENGWGALIPEGSMPIGNAQMVDGKIEIQLDYTLIPMPFDETTFTLGFDIQQSWTSVGVLPNAADDEFGLEVLAEKLRVYVHPQNSSMRPTIDGVQYKITSHAEPYTAEVFSSRNLDTNITEITIPETIVVDGITYTITNIGNYAFYGCSSLTSITIPNSVTSIGRRAFQNCSSLASITIPNSVTSIGGNAFYGCSSLNSIRVEATRPPQLGGEAVSASICYIPCGATFAYELSDWGYCVDVFVEVGCDICGDDLVWEYNDSQLSIAGYGDMYDYDIEPQPWQEYRNKITQISLPNGMTSVGASAFAECKYLKSVTIPSTVKKIHDSSFEDCRSLESVTFAGTALREIGDWAFYNCHSLKDITIPEGVTSIGKAAFFDCSHLNELTLPSTVQTIEDNAFGQCAQVKKMNVKAAVPPVVESETFEDIDRSIPVLVPQGTLKLYREAPYWQEFFNIAESEVMAGVENTMKPSTMTNCQKIIRDGNLVIIRDGVEYNVMGQQL